MFTFPEQVFQQLRDGFGERRIVVVGDAMLDRYLWGDVSRISPEAPVPVVRLTRRSAVAGGAANAAANLAGLGCRTTLVAAAGADNARDELEALLRGAGVESVLVPVPGFPTTVKTRVIGGHQQMLRLDEEAPRHLDAAALKPVIAAALAAVAQADAVILSDYAKGVVQNVVARAVIAGARQRGLPVLVDPKGTDWERYRGATTVTPNTSELLAVAGVGADDLSGLTAAAHRLQEQLELSFLIFTRGEHGIALIDRGRVDAIPAVAREVFDVSGAGDSVIATLAAGLAAGLLPADAMRVANIAAGVVVGKLGTVPITRDELERETLRLTATIPAGKVCSAATAATQVTQWKGAGERVVFTNGCFDVLHAGHVMILEKSRQAGDRLVVGLNSDASVRRLKGQTRPVNCLDDRAAVLAALTCVDLVVPFEEDTPLNLITLVRPDILIKGSDYSEDQVIGGREVRSWGGQVVLIDLMPGRSTTALLARVRDSGG